MNQPELSERLWDFAARVGKVVDALPDSHLGRDFVHKLSVALKELRETRGWLRFVVKAELLPHKQMAGHVDEAEQLCPILGKSVLTAKGRAGASPKRRRARRARRGGQHIQIRKMRMRTSDHGSSWAALLLFTN